MVIATEKEIAKYRRDLLSTEIELLEARARGLERLSLNLSPLPTNPRIRMYEEADRLKLRIEELNFRLRYGNGKH